MLGFDGLGCVGLGCVGLVCVIVEDMIHSIAAPTCSFNVRCPTI